MPNVMDKAEEAGNTHDGNSKAIYCEYKTARKFGEEIEAMVPTDQQEAYTGLLPELETIAAAAAAADAKHLAALRSFNAKARKWIDHKRGLTP